MTNTVNVRTAEPARTWRLDSAILLYANGIDAYATLHAIERAGRGTKGGTRLAPGVPATREACARFAQALADRAAFAGFIEPRMLYVGPQVAAWWRAPAPQRVWFETEDKPGFVGKRNAVTPHPGLVFALAHGELYVWAVKGADRPAPGTRLWFAPYFNVWPDGKICEGDMRRPDRVTPDALASFERAFFWSRFTHPNVTRARDFCLMKGGPHAFWRALLDNADAGGMPVFPQPLLAPLRRWRTLEAALAALEKHRHD